MSDALHDAIDAEVLSAPEASRRGAYAHAFHHLERAHILSQRITIRHVQVHWLMLNHGIVARNPREIFGQFARIIAAALFSRIWVPTGNTGGPTSAQCVLCPSRMTFAISLSAAVPNLPDNRTRRPRARGVGN